MIGSTTLVEGLQSAQGRARDGPLAAESHPCACGYTTLARVRPLLESSVWRTAASGIQKWPKRHHQTNDALLCAIYLSPILYCNSSSLNVKLLGLKVEHRALYFFFIISSRTRIKECKARRGEKATKKDQLSNNSLPTQARFHSKSPVEKISNLMRSAPTPCAWR